MNNILLVGNGFDLAHGLATSYNLFLKTIKNWNIVYTNIKNRKFANSDGKEEAFYACVSNMDLDNLNRLNELITKNSWIKYYCHCEAEIDKWIDFEREIYPVIELFELILQSEYLTRSLDGGIADALIDKKLFSPKLLRIAALWDNYVNTLGGHNVIVNSNYVTGQYGILRKKLLEDLRHEFDEFIEAFELYLHEFVYKRNDIKILKQIKELEIGSVISFNYTLTETLYGIDEQDVHHVHGMIREDLQTGTNNMVVGVNEQENQNMDFIYFVKYFQRIQKKSGIKYKEFERRNFENIYGRVNKEKYTVYIYGHSLDETDEDILKYVIGKVHSVDAYSDLEMKPEKVVIFFYDQADYEQKVINLIKLYGRSIVEKYTERGKFEFVPTSDEVWCE